MRFILFIFLLFFASVCARAQISVPIKAYLVPREALRTVTQNGGLVALGDIDGDRFDDLVYVESFDGNASGRMVAVSGETGKEIWSLDAVSQAPPGGKTFFIGAMYLSGDIDADGITDLTFVESWTKADRIVVSGKTGAIVARFSPTGATDVIDLGVTDLDNDGSRDRIFARRISQGPDKVGVTMLRVSQGKWTTEPIAGPPANATPNAVTDRLALSTLDGPLQWTTSQSVVLLQTHTGGKTTVDLVSPTTPARVAGQAWRWSFAT